MSDNRPLKSISRGKLLAQIGEWQDQATAAQQQAAELSGLSDLAAKGILLGNAETYLQCASDLGALISRGRA